MIRRIRDWLFGVERQVFLRHDEVAQRLSLALTVLGNDASAMVACRTILAHLTSPNVVWVSTEHGETEQ